MTELKMTKQTTHREIQSRGAYVREIGKLDEIGIRFNLTRKRQIKETSPRHLETLTKARSLRTLLE